MNHKHINNYKYIDLLPLVTTDTDTPIHISTIINDIIDSQFLVSTPRLNGISETLRYSYETLSNTIITEYLKTHNISVDESLISTLNEFVNTINDKYQTELRTNVTDAKNGAENISTLINNSDFLSIDQNLTTIVSTLNSVATTLNTTNTTLNTISAMLLATQTNYSNVKLTEYQTRQLHTLTLLSSDTFSLYNYDIVPLILDLHRRVGSRVITTPLSYFQFKNNKLTSVVADKEPDATRILIPATPIDTKENMVSCIGEKAFNGQYSVRSLIVPTNISAIETSAIVDCTNLVMLEFDNADNVSVLASKTDTLAIYNSPFTILKASKYIDNLTDTNGKNNIKTIIIPNTTTTISNDAFLNCTGVYDVFLGNSVDVISANAFKGCTNIHDVIIEDLADWSNINFENEYSNPLIYAKNLFVQNELVTTLTATKEIIGAYSFSGYKSLSTISFNDKLTDINKYAFYNCISITDITIPSACSSIDKTAFSGCTNAVFNVKSENTHYKSDSGSLYKKDGDNSRTILVRAAGNIDTLVLTGNITINDYAFDGCNNLTALILENISSLELEEYAFTNAPNLSIIINSDTSGAWVTNNGSLLSVESVNNTSISCLVRAYGDKLKYSCNFNVDNNISNISRYAFENNVISSITLSSSHVKESLSNVFSYCTNLTAVNINGSCEILTNLLFKNCTSLLQVNLDSDYSDWLTTIDELAFYNCKNLTAIGNYKNLLSNVTSIGNSAFYNCSKLQKIVLNSPDLSVIGSGAFYNCSLLELIDLRNTTELTAINKNTFRNCLLLKYAALNVDTIQLIDEYAFYGCQALKTFIIPQTPLLSVIGEYAFYNCKSLTTLTIPKLITTINESAFRNCINLTRVKFETVDKKLTLKSKAFYNCPNVLIYDFSSLSTLLEKTDGNFEVCDVNKIGPVLDAKDVFELYNDKQCWFIIPNPEYYRNKKSGAIKHTYTTATGYYSNLIKIPNNNWDTYKSRIKYRHYTICVYTDKTTEALDVEKIVSGSRPTLNAAKRAKLKEIYIGTNCDANLLKTIDTESINNCPYLEYIDFPVYNTPNNSNNLLSITLGSKAFSTNKKLTSVVIPESVVQLSTSTFECCTNLTYIEGLSRIEAFPGRVFAECTSLKCINIQNNSDKFIKTIGIDAFYKCVNLSSLVFYGKQEPYNTDNNVLARPRLTWSDYAFQQCVSLNTLIFNYAYLPRIANDVTTTPFTGLDKNSITLYSMFPPSLVNCDYIYSHTPDGNILSSYTLTDGTTISVYYKDEKYYQYNEDINVTDINSENLAALDTVTDENGNILSSYLSNNNIISVYYNSDGEDKTYYQYNEDINVADINSENLSILVTVTDENGNNLSSYLSNDNIISVYYNGEDYYQYNEDTFIANTNTITSENLAALDTATDENGNILSSYLSNNNIISVYYNGEDYYQYDKDIDIELDDDDLNNIYELSSYTKADSTIISVYYKSENNNYYQYNKDIELDDDDLNNIYELSSYTITGVTSPISVYYKKVEKNYQHNKNIKINDTDLNNIYMLLSYTSSYTLTDDTLTTIISVYYKGEGENKTYYQYNKDIIIDNIKTDKLSVLYEKTNDGNKKLSCSSGDDTQILYYDVNNIYYFNDTNTSVDVIPLIWENYDGSSSRGAISALLKTDDIILCTESKLENIIANEAVLYLSIKNSLIYTDLETYDNLEYSSSIIDLYNNDVLSIDTDEFNIELNSYGIYDRIIDRSLYELTLYLKENSTLYTLSNCFSVENQHALCSYITQIETDVKTLKTKYDNLKLKANGGHANYYKIECIDIDVVKIKNVNNTDVSSWLSYSQLVELDVTLTCPRHYVLNNSTGHILGINVYYYNTSKDKDIDTNKYILSNKYVNLTYNPFINKQTTTTATRSISIRQTVDSTYIPDKLRDIQSAYPDNIMYGYRVAILCNTQLDSQFNS